MKYLRIAFALTLAALLAAACGGDAPPAKAQGNKDEAPVANEYSLPPAPAEEPRNEAAKPMPPAAPAAAPAEGVKK